MSDDDEDVDEIWEDRGHANADPIRGIFNALDGAELRNVHNNVTGEDRVVEVGANQTTGEAIANGQFVD